MIKATFLDPPTEKVQGGGGGWNLYCFYILNFRFFGSNLWRNFCPCLVKQNIDKKRLGLKGIVKWEFFFWLGTFFGYVLISKLHRGNVPRTINCHSGLVKIQQRIHKEIHCFIIVRKKCDI